MKFKVGDKVIAKKNAPYNITTNGWKGTVTGLSEERFVVQSEDKKHKFDVYKKHFDLVTDNKIVITVNGDETVAKLYEGKKVVKTATAKCSPSDTFDFTTGAKLCFERLMRDQKKEPFVPHLVFKITGTHVGIIGNPTNYKDSVGRQLCVGDTVDLYDRSKGTLYGESVIAEDKSGVFVMGIKTDCCSTTGEIKGSWSIIKKRSYKEITNGETVNHVKYITERDN